MRFVPRLLMPARGLPTGSPTINHQRPHQGIGACPADLFYGISGDVEEALKQGCAENALRLALGQETRQPLYLLGKLGETDVRVTRKGDDIEVKVGDVIHEMIRMGAPYELDEHGVGKRGGLVDEMEGDDGAGAVPGGGDGHEGGLPDHGDLQDVLHEPSGAEPFDGEDVPCGDPVAGAEETRQEGQERRGAGDPRAYEEDGWFAEDGEALEDEV